MTAAQHPAEHQPHVRHDPVTGRPVFVAPQRGGKPDDRALLEQRGGTGDPHDWCPFCAGNEHRTPADVGRTPDDPAVPWRARIVPNAFPIATTAPGGTPDRSPRRAAGVHDVVIESRSHERSILGIDAADWRAVWSLCRRRLEAVAALPDVTWTTVFKNSGHRAGASLEHVHSQLVGLDLVPPAIEAEMAAVERDPATFPGLIDQARRDRRIVAELAGLVALVPPAPRQPYETWIVTDRAEPHFHRAQAAQVEALADLTRNLVGRLERLAPQCHYNWWLHQAPLRGERAADRTLDAWHWHLEIMPRLAELAGFEVGTGCHITTITAEESALRLRSQLA
ncbi:MAG: DUF4921 family protein [Planctomycetaceae bacterium]